MTEQPAPIEPLSHWALRRKRERLVVSRFQAKAALHDAGLLAQIEAYIETNGDAITQLAWQEAEFHRQSNLVSQIGAELGLTDEQMDTLFENAIRIEV